MARKPLRLRPRQMPIHPSPRRLSLQAKPPRLMRMPRQSKPGASARGDRELTAAMRKVLKQSGWPVLDKPRKDALNIQGTVVLDAVQGADQTVRLDWVVTAPKGKVLGHVSQANQVPAHSLDASWGAAAGYATQAAADGIFKLIGQYR